VLHTPSEHTFNGVFYPVEIQLVHTSEDGKLLYIAVPVSLECKNSCLNNLIEATIYGNDNPAIVQSGLYKHQVDELIRNVHKALKQFFYYEGTLTMPIVTTDGDPPVTVVDFKPGVLWFVIHPDKCRFTITFDTLAKLREHFTNNRRRVQNSCARYTCDLACNYLRVNHYTAKKNECEKKSDCAKNDHCPKYECNKYNECDKKNDCDNKSDCCSEEPSCSYKQNYKFKWEHKN